MSDVGMTYINPSGKKQINQSEINLAQSILDQKPYVFITFGTNKNTAHFKDVRRIKQLGGIKYYPIGRITKTASMAQKWGSGFFDLYWSSAIVLFENGHFEKWVFREEPMFKNFPNLKLEGNRRFLSTIEEKSLSEIKKFAQEKKIKGISGKKKQELIDYIKFVFHHTTRGKKHLKAEI